MRDRASDRSVAVIGGGLGGLAVATLLARRGRDVTLFERASTLGGRAATDDEQGFRLNRGPHALYRGGPAFAVLRDLGVPFTGSPPSASGGFALRARRRHALPGGLVSLLTTGLFPLPAKLETARLLVALRTVDPRPYDRTTVTAWLAANVRHPIVRELVGGLFRLTTYAADADRQSAGTALAQLQLALAKNVVYLDGGWQTLVDGLRDAAVAAGARVVTGARVVAVEHDGAVRAVRLADGTRHPADVAIVAGGPADAAAIVERAEETPLAAWAAAAIPVHAACLDVALARLPRPHARFALGIDEPSYCSVHSAAARLAPGDGAVVHVARYLTARDGGIALSEERRLEDILDLVQPGWRQAVVARRTLPRMVVSHALATADAGGTRGRPGPAVPGIRGLFVVGDWVGPDGLLADATLASARRAADLAVAGDAAPAAAA